MAWWLDNEEINKTSCNGSVFALDAVSLRSTEMYDQIVHGRSRPLHVSPSAQCMASRHAPLWDESPCPANVDGCTLILSQASGVQPFHSAEHKNRLQSTDPGVESSHHGSSSDYNDFVKPYYKKNQQHIVQMNDLPLSEAANTLSTHNLHNSLTDKCSGQYVAECSELCLASENSSIDSPEIIHDGPQLVGGEINSNDRVFKSTEKNGSYISPEMFTEIGISAGSVTTQHVGRYVRPETLELDIRTCVIIDRTTQGNYNESLNTDSGLASFIHDDKVIESHMTEILTVQ